MRACLHSVPDEFANQDLVEDGQLPVQVRSGLAAAELDDTLGVVRARAVLALVALRRGEIRDAAQHVQRCRAELAFGAPPSARLLCVWLEAHVAAAEDGPERAFEVLAPVYDDLGASDALLVEQPASAAWLVRAALAVGARSRAETVVARAEQLALVHSAVQVVVVGALHARNLLDGNPSALARAAERYPHRWARASAAEDAGVALARVGDPNAVARLEQASHGYAQAGAERDLARVRRRLRQLGVRRRHWTHTDRPVSGWDSLTGTERNVAALVSEGLTNHQVAERMFLSRHTVGFHLRQIFRKLDIGSRVQLTRLAVEAQVPA